MLTRRELRKVCDETPITLDGKPATVIGWKNTFLTVACFGAHGLRAEFADETIERIVTRDKKRGEFHW
jgi:hypothetical protein